jgi:nicotinamidase-related amidase
MSFAAAAAAAATATVPARSIKPGSPTFRPPASIMPITLEAQPFEYRFDPAHSALVIIDMQRDFVEPGGFGESLGNNVALLQAIIPTCRAVLDAWRATGALVVHTREAHLPDLSDCPPAKRLRGSPTLRIGDEGPMGRILVAGEPGNQIVPELAPLPGEWVIDKPGKGMFYATGLHERLQVSGISHLVFMGVTTEVCVQTSMREANDRGYDCLLVEDGTESYFPAFKAAALDMIRAQGAIVGWTASAAILMEGLRA